MPVRKKKAALKTTLLASAGTVVSWGAQQITSGEPVYGLAAVVSGFVLIAGYVVLQEGDLPYEDEIVDVIASQTPEQTAQTAKDVTEAAVGSVDGCDDSEREA